MRQTDRSMAIRWRQSLLISGRWRSTLTGCLDWQRLVPLTFDLFGLTRQRSNCSLAVALPLLPLPLRQRQTRQLSQLSCQQRLTVSRYRLAD
jgi:hypothetical protein